MTPAELVTTVCKLYSRPDMEYDLLNVQFSSFLSKAHSLDNFRRDLKKLYITDPVIVNGVVSVDLSAELSAMRVIREIHMFSTYTTASGVVYPGTPIVLPTPYEESSGAAQFNYYGFQKSRQYALIGNNLTLTDVDSNCKCIEILAIVPPTYAQNITTGAWETNSWIMQKYPELIQAYCRRFIVSNLKDTTMLQAAELNFNQQSQAFLAAVAQEILPW